MKTLAAIFCICAIFGLTPAMAEQRDCNIDLFKAYVDNRSSDVTDLLSYQLVTQENYDAVKDKAKASVPEYFSGSWEQFKEKRDKASSESQLKYHRDQIQSLVSSTVDQNGLDAYRACIGDQRPLSATFERSPTPKIAKLSLGFHPQTVVPARNPLEIKYFGGRPFGSSASAEMSGTLTIENFHTVDTSLMFERQPGEPLVLTITMPEYGIASNDVNLPVPPKFKSIVQKEDVAGSTNTGHVDQDMAHDVGKSAGPYQSCVTAHDGWTISPNTAKFTSAATTPGCVSGTLGASTSTSACFIITLSVNKGQWCDASWTTQATQERTVQIVDGPAD